MPVGFWTKDFSHFFFFCGVCPFSSLLPLLDRHFLFVSFLDLARIAFPSSTFCHFTSSSFCSDLRARNSLRVYQRRSTPISPLPLLKSNAEILAVGLLGLWRRERMYGSTSIKAFAADSKLVHMLFTSKRMSSIEAWSVPTLQVMMSIRYSTLWESSGIATVIWIEQSCKSSAAWRWLDTCFSRE